MAPFPFEKYLPLVLLIVILIPMLSGLFPVFLPFLLALALAKLAEPVVSLFEKKLQFKRSIASGIGVTAVFFLAGLFLLITGAFFMKLLQQLTDLLPHISRGIQQGTTQLQQWLRQLAQRAPSGLQGSIDHLADRLFESSTLLLEQALGQLPKLLTGTAGLLSQGLLGTVTTVLAAYMLSIRLPLFSAWISSSKFGRARPALRQFRYALGRWLLAQGKLALIALVLLSLGFLLLKIPNALLWASIVTLVDILPVLGVGTVLLPWSLVSYLQGNTAKALGLLGIFGLIWLVRSVLEPKLVSKELGVDPLVTLIAIYAGFRLWGIVGMLLSPILAICATEVIRRLRH